MSTRVVSPDEYRKGFAKPAKKAAKKRGTSTGPTRQAHNYRSKKTVGLDGFTYDSALEAKQGNEYFLQKKSGVIIDYIRQVPIVFACGKRWRVDFMVIWDQPDQVSFTEVKGRANIDRDWMTVKKLLKHEKPWIWERLTVRTK